MEAPVVRAVDPFDLPEWLADGEVTWTATTSVHAGHLVPGELVGTAGVYGAAKTFLDA